MQICQNFKFAKKNQIWQKISNFAKSFKFGKKRISNLAKKNFKFGKKRISNLAKKNFKFGK